MRRASRWFGLAALCTALALSFAACGGAGSNGDKTPRLFMMSVPPGDDYFYTIEQSAKREAARLGADLEIQQVASLDASSQLSVLNAGIAKHPDAILVNPLDVDALQAPIEDAVKRGIKVITYDVNTGKPKGVVSTFVSADITELGRNAAHAQLDAIGRNGKVFYQGSATGVTFFNSLQEGWKDVMDAAPGIEQLPAVYSNYEPSKANAQMEALLTANPDLSGGFAGIFLDQQGEVPALERAGEIGKVKLVGVDGASPNVQRLRDGALSAIVSVKAVDYGTQVVRTALEAIDGRKLPAQTVIGQCVLTARNLDDPANAACIYDNAPSK